MNEWALAVIENIYNEQYRAAEEDARKIIKKYPSHPAGFFFMAAVIDSWMAVHLSGVRENEFYRFCELAVEKGDKLLERNPGDEWAKFFVGGAEGYKGTYEARFDRWITAFRYGWKGVSILSQLKEQNSDLVDINYGIGSYEYWRSALTKNLRWMPGVVDKRSKGIEKVKKARESGVYTKVASSIGLIDIYLNEKAYAFAITIADESLLKYPRSRIFLLGKAKGLLGKGNYWEAENIFRQVLVMAEKNPGEEHATIALCHFWIAKTYFSDAHFSPCITECDLMKNYQFDDETKKFLLKYFDEIEWIKKQAIESLQNSRHDKSASEKP
jgi:tetratricopeptide (TPR) repeat protein